VGKVIKAAAVEPIDANLQAISDGAKVVVVVGADRTQ